jgi:phosphotransferase system  glucose/maltose/N-acetylglucosamine-specific IIC component
MKALLLTFTTPMLVLCAAAIFVILFATILRTLKEMSLFTPGTSAVVALAASVLCMMGLHHFLVSGEGGHTVSGRASEVTSQTGIEIILLPYAALAIAILLCLLLLAIARIFAGRRREEYPAREKAIVTKSEKHQSIDNEEKRIRK